MFDAVGIRRTLLCIVKYWCQPGESLVIILLEIFHGFESPKITLPLSQHPHKVSLLLRQIALAPLVYLVCLSNHIRMYVARVRFLPGK